MAITLTELFDSRETQVEEARSSIDLRYGLFGSDDDIEIRNFLEETLDADYLGLPLQRYRLSPMGSQDVWLVVATYSTHEVREDGVVSISLDTTGGTQNVKQSLETKTRVMATGKTGPAADFKGAINVSGDTINGVDIQVGGGSLTLDVRYEKNDISTADILALAKIKPYVNSEVFFGLAAGEVLYLGASGSKRGSDQWEVSFRFAISKNVRGLNTGSEFALQIEGFTTDPTFVKEGWDYAWVLYERDASNATHVLVPRTLYIERVYDRGRFYEALKIPQAFN